MGFTPHELRSAAHDVGMYVQQTRDFDGNEVEGQFTLFKGDYIRMAGNYQEIMDAIDAEHRRITVQVEIDDSRREEPYVDVSHLL